MGGNMKASNDGLFLPLQDKCLMNISYCNRVRNRTRDHPFTREKLCHLSYLGTITHSLTIRVGLSSNSAYSRHERWESEILQAMENFTELVEELLVEFFFSHNYHREAGVEGWIIFETNNPKM